jgi:hypothetical protein
VTCAAADADDEQPPAAFTQSGESARNPVDLLTVDCLRQGDRGLEVAGGVLGGRQGAQD